MQKKYFFLYIILQISAMKSFAQDIKLNWTFTDPRTNIEYPLGLKGSIQEGLIQNNLLPDPFDQMNENLFLWIEDHIWTCRTQFDINNGQLSKQNIEIYFPNIDTYADVFINDSLIIQTNNAFKPWHKEIKKYLKLGTNNITVKFTPPVIFHRAEYDTMPYHLPAINDVSDIAIASMVRKPQFQFGWDWALRMVTMGFNETAEIKFFNKNLYLDHNIQTVDLNIENSTANLYFSMHFLNPLDSNDTYTWQSNLFGKLEISEIREKNIESLVQINEVKFWWPRNHGEPNLYNDTWTLTDQNGNLLAKTEVTFGVKKSELIQKEDQWGTSFEIWVNNQPIFCKGGDYIPQDIFLSRITREERLKMVEMMAASNFNMVRVWGGGDYAKDDFLEACDKEGIMVWHDLMFACSVYPGDSAYLKNVEEEFEYHMPRIAKHASLILLNGNNEVDVAWKNWGFQIRYGIHGEDAKTVERNYDKLFKELAPTVIDRFTNVPYVHTSPLGHWTDDAMFDHGTQHYWGVWHGKDEIEDFSRKIGRFNAEYGFESFPEFSTLLTFSNPDQWNLDSAVMKHHQKSYVGNGMIEKHARRLYGKMPNFETFVYYSQLTQAKAISMAIAGHRVDAPRCMGTLYWQLNDCWPAPSWSSIDYFNNWKALQYEVQKDYKSVTIVERINKLDKEEYYFVSDLNREVQSKITMTAYNFKGKVKEQKTFDVKLNQLGSLPLVKAKDLKDEDDNLFIKFVYIDENNIKQVRCFVHEPDSYREAQQKHFSLSLVNNDSLNKKITLRITSEKFLNDLWITSKFPGLSYSENFISMLPGIKEIIITYENEPKIEDFTWLWR